MQTESQSHGSITQWIQELRNNDPDATRKIWNRFVSRLVGVANRRLKNSSCRVVDGDVVAADAFRDFFQRSPDDFAKLVNRNDLWQILVMITERRAIDAIRRETSLRNGNGKVYGETLLCGSDDENQQGLNSLPGTISPPDIELMLIEAFDERLGSLETDLLRQIAIDRVHGLANVEIAEKHNMSLRSVERKIGLIRKAWKSN